jgi:hypothetical protein
MVKIDFSDFYAKIGPPPEQSNTQDAPKAQQTRSIDSINESLDQARAAFKHYQDNIKRSELLRSQINQGITNKDPHYNLLMLSLECIASMTGDEIFYTENKKKLERE